MVKAEDYVTKAYQLKSKKVPYKKRVGLFKKACTEFAKAYELNPHSFTLMRIGEAVDVCQKAGNKLETEKFGAFEAEYIQNHPAEYEWGDTDAALDAG